MRLILISILALLSHFATAQLIIPKVDIVCNQNDKELSIDLVPDGDFKSLFSSIVFTVKTLDSSLSIRDFTLNPELGNSISIVPSRSEFYSGYYYYTFAGFGFTPMTYKLIGGESRLLGTFKIDNNFEYIILNDEVTESLNGDFYISLNGIESNGEIYNRYKTNIINTYAVPNPHINTFQLVGIKEYPVTISILDTSGRIVLEKISYGGDISTDGLKPGFYILRAIGEGIDKTLSITKL